MALPPLRDELSLLAGPAMADGQPSWTLHDPVRDTFFRIDWPTFEILSRWHTGDAQRIADEINRATTLQLEPQSVAAVAKFLTDNELIEPGSLYASGRMASRLQAMEGSAWQKFIHNYLFFRVPLWRPDAWLERWQPVAQLFQTRGFLMLTLAALVADAWLISSQSQVFYGTLVDTFSLQGLLAYGAALIAVKFLHELGHAFTAKRYGCRVPTMGIAFLVMWPVAYTDTNAVWRLTDRWQRLRVSCAGIAVELIVAIWAMLAWALLPPGALRSAAYFLGTTSWMMTLLVNASPFMRFDGYFILCDLLDMPNLHARSFALARWRLREWLFRLGEPPPEYFSATRQRALILFAIAVWLYRLIVFLGIAALVYHFTIKLVGIVLFVIEIHYFIAMPIIRELRTWKDFLPLANANPDSLAHRNRLIAGLAVLALLVCAPLPSRVTASGILRPVQTWTIIAPETGQIVHSALIEGQSVAAGESVVQLSVGDLDMQAQINAARIQQASWQAASAGLSPTTRSDWQVNRQKLASAISESDAIAASRDRLDLKAPFPGMIGDVEPGMAQGQWVARGERLGVAFAPGPMVVETYLYESDVKRVLGSGPINWIPMALWM